MAAYVKMHNAKIVYLECNVVKIRIQKLGFTLITH